MDADVMRGADGQAVARLANIVAQDRAKFEQNVRTAIAQSASPRKLLERELLGAMDLASQSEMVWGTDDCALWCANILRAALGYDGAALFRGRYRTRKGAHRLLGKHGLAGALNAAARKHRWRRIKTGEQVGDIGIAVLGGIPSTVICRAPGWFVGRNESGFTAMPSSNVRIIWTVI